SHEDESEETPKAGTNPERKGGSQRERFPPLPRAEQGHNCVHTDHLLAKEDNCKRRAATGKEESGSEDRKEALTLAEGQRVASSLGRPGRAPSPPSLLPAVPGFANGCARAHEPGLPCLPARHADSARPQRLTADPVGGKAHPPGGSKPAPSTRQQATGDRRHMIPPPRHALSSSPRPASPWRVPPTRASLARKRSRRRRTSSTTPGHCCLLTEVRRVDSEQDKVGDPAMKQFLLHLDESNALGKKFIIQDIDDTHVFVIAEFVNVLQERVGELMDQNAFSLTQNTNSSLEVHTLPGGKAL
ncbi:hypothetical protein MC885_003324, partial [Smutsia gigantea]